MIERPPPLADESAVDPREQRRRAKALRDLGAGGAMFLDTRLVAPQRRFDLWTSANAGGAATLSMDTERRASFSGFSRFFPTPSLLLADIEASSHNVTRHRREIQHSSLDQIVVLLINRGTLHFEQNGKTLFGGPSDALVYNMDVPLRFAHYNTCSVQVIGLNIENFSSGFINDSPYIITSRLSPLAPIVAGYMRSLPRDLSVLSRSADFVAGQLVALILRALSTDTPVTPVPRPALFEAIRAAIEAEIGNPDLSAKLLCLRLGVSRSTLFEAVAARGMTLADMILHRRLAGCMEEMRRAGQPYTLAAICQRWGFRDASTFSRAFQRKHNCTPTEWQRTILGQAG